MTTRRIVGQEAIKIPFLSILAQAAGLAGRPAGSTCDNLLAVQRLQHYPATRIKPLLVCARMMSHKRGYGT